MPITAVAYDIVNEFNLAEMMEHFDSDYIFDIINNKLDNINYSNPLQEPNVVTSFEETFKNWFERFPGDDSNIRIIRWQVYLDIIHVLCDRFNLRFNEEDDTINRYTAAYYLYDFLVCNRVNYIVSFFTSFIVNNKDSLCSYLNLEEYRKNKDTAASYGKRIYTDPKYGAISSNMVPVLQHIASLDISLYNIFQSIYTNPILLEMMDNIVADKGTFFNTYYASILDQPENLPIIIVNIRLALQNLVGDLSPNTIQEVMAYANPEENALVALEVKEDYKTE